MRRVEVALDLGHHGCLDLLLEVEPPVVAHEPLVVENILDAALEVAQTGLLVAREELLDQVAAVGVESWRGRREGQKKG